MKLGADLQAFAARIGHSFADPALLVRALTHASLSSPNRASNERMEFLGDRVLALVMSEALFAADPGASEGLLARRLNALVRLETCADVARELGLGDVLKLGRSEMLSGGRRKEALLGDALEAVIAAVFLDAGFAAAGELVRRLWGARLSDGAQSDARDAKSALQEWAQAQGLGLPLYEEMGREGPDHAPLFTLRVSVAGRGEARASAKSKRAAEQMAAEALLEELERKDD